MRTRGEPLLLVKPLQGLLMVSLAMAALPLTFSVNGTPTAAAGDPRPRPDLTEPHRQLRVCDASSLISQHEGTEPCVYTDSTGHKTIGVGYNLDQPGAEAEIDSLGLNFADVYSGKTCLTTVQIDTILETTLATATEDARASVSNFELLCCGVQNVVVDMVFNMGGPTFSTFTTFIALIEQQQWAKASTDMQGTLWCGQVGTRCTGDAAAVAAGCGGPSPPPPPGPLPPPPGPPTPGNGCTACVATEKVWCYIDSTCHEVASVADPCGADQCASNSLFSTCACKTCSEAACKSGRGPTNAIEV